MKPNIFKYIFFVIAVMLIIISIYIVYSSNNFKTIATENNKENMIIKNDITIGITNYDTINPILSNNKDVQYLSKLIFDSLLEIDEDFTIKEGLAEEYSKLDETTYLIKLKEDIKWHDGTEFTASDVKFTIDSLKNNSIESIYSEQIKNIDEVKEINDYIIKIYLKEETPFFEYMLNFPILASHMYEETSLYSKSDFPIGTGRYKITYMDDKYIKLEKTNKKSNKKIEQIKINIYNSFTELYTAFSKGEINLMNTDNINYEKYIGTIGYNFNNSPGREFDYIVINTKNKYLSNIKVRQAINNAIDRKNIIYNVFNNKYHIANFSMNNENYLYSGNTANKYNLKEAERLIEEAGINSKITLDLLVNIEKEERKKVANEIKRQLSDIGIEINIKEVSSQNLERHLRNNDYDLILTGNIISTNPNLSTYLGDGNLSNYYNNEVINILEDLNSITQSENLKTKYKEIINIYEEEIPFISLYFNANITLYHNNIKGNMNHNWYNIFNNIDEWYRVE